MNAEIDEVRHDLLRHLGRQLEGLLRLADALDADTVGVKLDGALAALSWEIERPWPGRRQSVTATCSTRYRRKPGPRSKPPRGPA